VSLEDGMSATKQLLTILQAKGPLTVEELASITDMDVGKVRVTLAHMRDYGYLTSRPATYAVTPKGLERAVAPDATEESKKRLARKKARLAGISAEAAEAVREARKLDTMVSRSIRTRPALEQAWGVFA
jgi:DNA-binding MarR family transcriptional regulator